MDLCAVFTKSRGQREISKVISIYCTRNGLNLFKNNRCESRHMFEKVFAYTSVSRSIRVREG